MNVETRERMGQQQHPLCALLPTLCSILVLFLYASATLVGDFVHEEVPAVLSNPDVMGTSHWKSIWKHDYVGSPMKAGKGPSSYRPLGVLSLRLSRSLHGMRPWSFHLGNIFFYCIICVQFSLLSQRILDGMMHEFKRASVHPIVIHSGSWVSAILFTIHPIHTEPVISVVGRSDLLCALFFLGALQLALHLSPSKRATRGYYALAMFFGVVSSFCKEEGKTVFFVLSFYEVICSICRNGVTTKRAGVRRVRLLDELYRKQSSGLAHDNVGKPLLYGNYLHRIIKRLMFHLKKSKQICCDVRNSCPLSESFNRCLVCLLCYVMQMKLRVLINGGHSLLNDEHEVPGQHNAFVFLLSCAQAHAIYAWKLVYPLAPLSVDHSWPCVSPIYSLFDLANVGSLLLYITLAKLSYLGTRNGNIPILSSIMLSILPLLPVCCYSSVQGENILLLPSIGVCLGAGVWCNIMTSWCLSSLLDQKSIKSKSRVTKFNLSRRQCVLGSLYTFLLINLYCVSKITISRCVDWKSDTTLFESALTMCPDSVVSLTLFAASVVRHDRTSGDAAKMLDKALSLIPTDPDALYHRALIHYYEKEHFDAIGTFQQSLSGRPTHAKSRLFLGESFLQLANDVEGPTERELLQREALLHTEIAIKYGEQNYPRAYAMRCELGFILDLPIEETLEYCHHAVALNRRVKALGLKEDLIVEEITINTIAIILKQVGRMNEATETLLRGLQENPKSIDLLVNAGGLHAENGTFSAAMDYYNRALKLSPQNPLILVNIGWLFEVNEGNLTEAEFYYEQAYNLMQPNPHPQIIKNLENVKHKRLIAGNNSNNPGRIGCISEC